MSATAAVWNFGGSAVDLCRRRRCAVAAAPRCGQRRRVDLRTRSTMIMLSWSLTGMGISSMKERAVDSAGNAPSEQPSLPTWTGNKNKVLLLKIICVSIGSKSYKSLEYVVFARTYVKVWNYVNIWRWSGSKSQKSCHGPILSSTNSNKKLHELWKNYCNKYLHNYVYADSRILLVHAKLKKW